MSSRSRIAIVLTRDLTTQAGRPAMVKNLIETLARSQDVEVLRLRNVLELKSIASFAGVLAVWALSILRFKPLPLQCLLYASPREIARVTSQICAGRFDTVYLDTVRCQMLLRAIRRTNRDLRIITDFDDLMSRRMSLLNQCGLPVMTGHVAKALPGWLRRFVEGPGSRTIRLYEAATLGASELETIFLSDAVVLVSHAERLELLPRLPDSLHSRVCAIPPLMPLRAAAWTASGLHCFIFIGSDRIIQNSTAIDRLIEMWRRLRPLTALHIYGTQIRPPQSADGVHWHGPASDLHDVYRPGSILILPAVLAGGVKTKVAEAWAYGCPVLGNANAFEGFNIKNYPLDLPETAWDDYILHPERHDALWTAAARAGQDFVAQRLSPQAFGTDWERLMPADSRLLPSHKNRASPSRLPLPASTAMPVGYNEFVKSDRAPVGRE